MTGIYNDPQLSLLLLIQSSTEPGGAGIGMQQVGQLWISIAKYWSSCQFVDDGFECSLALHSLSIPKRLFWIKVGLIYFLTFSSLPNRRIPCREVIQGSDNLGKVLHESPVIPGES